MPTCFSLHCLERLHLGVRIPLNLSPVQREGAAPEIPPPQPSVEVPQPSREPRIASQKPYTLRASEQSL